MVAITPKQKKVLKVIEAAPGSAMSNLCSALKLVRSDVADVVKGLWRKGLVERRGLVKHYTYYPIQKPFIVTKNGRMPKGHASISDALVQQSSNYKLSEKQQVLLKDNADKPRSELARLLGISKLQLNFILDKGEDPE